MKTHTCNCLTILIGIFILSGCMPRSPMPLTDRSLELMSASRYAFARVDFHGKQHKQLELKPEQYETMRSLVSALTPIRECRVGKIFEPDYTLTYQGGMDPTQVDVKIVEDKMEFGVQNFVYIGGDANEFRKVLPIPPETEL